MIKAMQHFNRLLILLLFISVDGFAKNATLPSEIIDKPNEKAVQIAVQELPMHFSLYVKERLEQQYRNLFFDPLFRWDNAGELEGRLVDAWQQIEPGVMRFHLKENIYFHSGNLLTSKDITWTYQKILNMHEPLSFLDEIESVIAIDDYTFEVRSSLSEARVLDYLTYFYIFDSIFYTQYEIDPNKPLGVLKAPNEKLPLSGTGPYIIKEYNPQLHLRTVVNKNYWGKASNIPELRFVKIRSEKSRLFALLVNDVDIGTNIPSHNIATEEVMSSKSFVKVNSEQVILLTINDKKSPIFADREARSAIILAINQLGKVKNIASGMGILEDAFMPMQSHHSVLLNSGLTDYDLKKSRKIIKDLKIPKQLTILVMKDQSGYKKQVLAALTSMMKKTGIQLVYTEAKTREEWIKNQPDYDLSLSIWLSRYRNVENNYDHLFNDSDISSFINLLAEQKKIDSMISKPWRFFDEAQQEYYITPLFFKNTVWGADNKYNFEEVFSVTGVPYWNKLKVVTPTN
ncbi:MAG: ABC transporter substrate-binding protein [Psychromonas sp.]